jgi:hypothetical protein
MNPNLFTRFPTTGATPIPSGFTKRFPLHTEKLIGGAWVRMASFPASTTQERLRRHVKAFGGNVRLLRGDLLLAEWSCGVVVEDWRESA